MSSAAPTPETAHPEALNHAQLWRDCGDLVMRLPDVHISRLAVNAAGQLDTTLTWRGTPTEALYSRSLEGRLVLGPIAGRLPLLGTVMYAAMGRPEQFSIEYQDQVFSQGVIEKAPLLANVARTQRALRASVRRFSHFTYNERYRRTPAETEAGAGGRTRQLRASQNYISPKGMKQIAELNYALALITGHEVERHTEVRRIAELPVDRSAWPDDLPAMLACAPYSHVGTALWTDANGLERLTVGEVRMPEIFSITDQPAQTDW